MELDHLRFEDLEHKNRQALTNGNLADIGMHRTTKVRALGELQKAGRWVSFTQEGPEAPLVTILW